uniref:uncharacterized protein n=1 Tax=Suillus clintonianus TaxID=1904413 RepID=UPI001B85EB34|nr:uncharacterized protein DEU56DRAFT_184377 [Suillus clintonianus]KAG2145848.1 hypothetical protein DEU56DRAFT_184377 [Suillus clintonianus]
MRPCFGVVCQLSTLCSLGRCTCVTRGAIFDDLFHLFPIFFTHPLSKRVSFLHIVHPFSFFSLILVFRDVHHLILIHIGFNIIRFPPLPSLLFLVAFPFFAIVLSLPEMSVALLLTAPSILLPLLLAATSLLLPFSLQLGNARGSLILKQELKPAGIQCLCILLRLLPCTVCRRLVFALPGNTREELINEYMCVGGVWEARSG